MVIQIFFSVLLLTNFIPSIVSADRQFQPSLSEEDKQALAIFPPLLTTLCEMRNSDSTTVENIKAMARNFSKDQEVKNKLGSEEEKKVLDTEIRQNRPYKMQIIDGLTTLCPAVFISPSTCFKAIDLCTRIINPVLLKISDNEKRLFEQEIQHFTYNADDEKEKNKKFIDRMPQKIQNVFESYQKHNILFLSPALYKLLVVADLLESDSDFLISERPYSIEQNLLVKNLFNITDSVDTNYKNTITNAIVFLRLQSVCKIEDKELKDLTDSFIEAFPCTYKDQL